MSKNNLDKVGYEDIIPYALLKFKKMDCVDIYLLLKQFREANIAEVIDDLFNLERFNHTYHDEIILQGLDGSYSLAISVSDDSNERRANIIRNNTEDIVKKFFNKFNINKFKSDKKKILDAQEKIVLEKARILLISDDDLDYDILKRLGFKYIDYFKSKIVADNYFKEYEDEINKYNVVLKRSLKMDFVPGFLYFDLDEKIYSLSCSNSILRFRYKDFTRDIHFADNIWQKEYSINSTNYSELLNIIVENSIINEWDGVIDPKYQRYQMIQSLSNKKRIPLPNDKKEIKIRFDLWQNQNIINDNLGLDITTNGNFDDVLRNKTPFLQTMRDKFGDFDIIISENNKVLNPNLLDLDKECGYQCELSGRDLVLLVEFSNNPVYELDSPMIYDMRLADKITIKYCFAGRLSNNLDGGKDEFRILKNDNQETKENCIVNQVIRLYNDALKHLGVSIIEDENTKTIEEYETEYIAFEAEREAIYQAERQPIVEFDKFNKTVKKYLEYKECGFIRGNLDRLIIDQQDDKISVSSVFDGRILGNISFSKNYFFSDYRNFSIQRPTKKGIGNVEQVAFYTSKYNNDSNNVKRPNEQQMDFINAFYKNIEFTLSPLVDNVSPEDVEVAKKRFVRKKIY